MSKPLTLQELLAIDCIQNMLVIADYHSEHPRLPVISVWRHPQFYGYTAKKLAGQAESDWLNISHQQKKAQQT